MVVNTRVGQVCDQVVLEQQQKRLRRQYGLPTGDIVTDPIVLQIPPSLRDMPSEYYNNTL